MSKLFLRLWKKGLFAFLVLLVLAPLVFSMESYAGQDEPPIKKDKTTALTQSLLHNPNFDNGIWYEFNKRYQAAYPTGVWLPAGNTYDDPQDWRLWFVNGTAIIDAQANATYRQSNPESVEMWPFDYSASTRMVAGLYQAVPGVTPCRSYKFQMYAYSRQEEASDSLNALRVGIEQTGWHPDSAVDPAVHSWPSTMVWGEPKKYTGGFGPLEVTATALSNKIAVFSYADALGGASHKIHWDTTSLVAVARTENLIDASQPLPAPSGVIQNLSRTVDQVSNSAVVSWNTSVNAYGQLLYRVKGAGSWQYSAIRPWGTSHQVNLTGLQAGATYEYVAVAYGYVGGACKSLVSNVDEFNMGTPLSGVNITGNEDIQGVGYLGQSYTFTANASPSNATEPIDYVWQASDQSQVTHPDSGTQDSVTFSWNTIGVKQIKVTVSNVANSVEATYVIDIIGDEYEPDDTCSQAKAISVDGVSQARTFHSNADVDWVYFDGTAGAAYFVEALTPPGSDADVSLAVYDACPPGAPVTSQAYTYTLDARLPFTATETGRFYLRLQQDPSTPGTAMAYNLSVRILPQQAAPGALVLVAGKLYDDDPLQSNIYHAADAAYQMFKNQGYDDEDIYYLTPDAHLDADARSTHANLFWAISEWAADRLASQPNSSFTLYMVDHGAYDTFYLDGTLSDELATVSPSDLDAWLTDLEASVPGVQVNVIVEACQSGSFIDLQETLSAEGRVVIASTGAQQPAWATKDGVLFSDHFVTAINQGMNLYTGFQQAASAVEIAQPAQTPWLDDDGDGWPNETGDGETAAGRDFISVETLGALKWPPYIVSAGLDDIVAGQGVITAEVRDDGGAAQVWAVVYPPEYEPPALSGDGVGELVLESAFFVTLTHQGGNLYSGEYDGFSTLQLGSDRVVIYAMDDDGMMGRPLSIGEKRYVYLPLVLKH